MNQIATAPSGDDVRSEDVLDLPDHVLEDQLALLETLGMDLVEARPVGQPDDLRVEFAVLDLELLEPLPQECEELLKISSASLATAKRNR